MRGGSAAASQEQRPELTVVCRRGNRAQVLWGGGNWEGSPPRGMWPWTQQRERCGQWMTWGASREASVLPWPLPVLFSTEQNMCLPWSGDGPPGSREGPAALTGGSNPLRGPISARSRMGTADINSPCEWAPPPPLSSQDCCPVLPAPFVCDPFSHKPRMSLLLSQGSFFVLEPRQ